MIEFRKNLRSSQRERLEGRTAPAPAAANRFKVAQPECDLIVAAIGGEVRRVCNTTQ